MKLNKLFQLLIVGGALTGGATGCGPEGAQPGDNGADTMAAGGGAQQELDGGIDGGAQTSGAGGGAQSGSGGGSSGAGGGVSFW